MSDPSVLTVPEPAGLTIQSSRGKCCSDGCPLDKAFAPVFILRNKRNPKLVVRAVLDVGLCADHKAVTKLGDLMTDSGWNTILAAYELRKEPRPTRSLTALDFVPYNGPEARAARQRVQ